MITGKSGRPRLAAALAWIAATAWAVPVFAAGFEVQVTADGAPLEGAVLSLHGASAPVAGRAVMDQRNTAFEPGVLVIQAGTAVSFPNSDTVRHQVYSFSPAKPFELPLYSGTPPEPVVFGQPGVVVVGCNIHDWMIGWIVVLDTPHHARSGADGIARLDVPDGDYRLQAWHPRLAGEAVVQAVSVPGDRVSVDLELGPPPPERRGSDRLRALQDRLRSLRKDD
ncbi:methylamine utilization protein [Arenimonas sp.]|uniref:methylamine utilization protein n=1 Tax=Arenimonas sp. TaxID=1872635 RepID=UPI0035ADB489